MEQSEENLKAQRIINIKKHLEDWCDAKNEELIFTRLSSLTNKVFQVENIQESEPSPQYDKLIYREFGQGRSDYINCKQEQMIFEQLSKLEMAPEIYGGDETYRIEQFMSGGNIPLKELQKPENLRKALFRMAQFHNSKVQVIDNVPMFKKVIEDKSYLLEKVEFKIEKGMWTEDEKEKLQEISTIINQKELDYLSKLAPQDVSFCHNDLVCQNIMLVYKSLQFIDYEYSGTNYTAYDLANFLEEMQYDYGFNQAPYFKFDPQCYPDDMKLMNLIKLYIILTKYKHLITLDIQQDLWVLEKGPDTFIKKFKLRKDIFKLLPIMLKDVKACQLYCNWYWICIAILQSKQDPNISFDFIELAFQRAQNYKKYKSSSQYF